MTLKITIRYFTKSFGLHVHVHKNIPSTYTIYYKTKILQYFEFTMIKTELSKKYPTKSHKISILGIDVINFVLSSTYLGNSFFFS